MKEIKAFVRPIKANDVYKALHAHGFCCMTLTDCEGTGMYTDPDKDFPSLKFPFMHSKRVKIEIVCIDEEVEPIIEIIREHGKTGHSGDGIVYVSGVDEVYRIRNNTKGADVIC
ncbi:MAG: P-II family nitrogen regulator [Saprospiraceae bacterium]|nr:P-II family nitrogen regulator [Saprospiraceae bacterium]